MKPDLQAVYDHYGLKILNGHGDWVKAQCPLPSHEDINPSASVNTDEGLWRCHACAEGGDAYDIVKARENVDTGFADLKRRTAEIAGGSDAPVSRQPAGSSLLSGRSRSKRTYGNWTPPWGRL